MPEQKVILRTFDGPPASRQQAIDKATEMVILAEKLLERPEWRHKEYSSVQLTFSTPFYNPEKSRDEVKFRLPEVRNSVINFGQYEGTRLDEIPISYLEYLYEAQRELQDRLKFYLNHPTIKQEREDG